MLLRYLFCGLLFHIGTSILLPAQSNLTFLKTFPNIQRGYTICPTGDGNLYVGGAVIGRTALLKLAPNGDVLSSYFLDFDTGNLDNVSELILDSEGMIVGCGLQGAALLGTAFVFRYNPATHTVLWATSLQEEIASFNGLLEKSPGGDYVVYGEVQNNTGSEALILQVDRLTGALVPAFANRYLPGRFASFNAVVAHDSTLYAVGRASTNLNAAPPFGTRSMLTRLDTTSPIPLWMRLSGAPIPGPAEVRGRDLIIEGNAILTTYTGNLTDSTQPSTTFFLQKHHLDGTIEWRKEYDLTEWDNEQAEELIAVPDGYVLYGRASHGDEGSLFVLKTNKAGEQLWSNKLHFGYNDGFAPSGSQQGQIVAINNSLFFTATTRDVNGGTRMLLLKATSNGKMGDSCSYWTPTPLVVHALVDLPDAAAAKTVLLEENPLLDAPHTTALAFPASVETACSMTFPTCTDSLDLGPDIVLCRDSMITFHAGSGFVDYLWQDGSTDSTYTTSAYGVYSVEVTDACGQQQRDTVLLTVSLLGDTPFPDSTICAGEVLTASMPGFDAYLWTPAAALNCDTCATVLLQPTATTTYTLFATTTNGCVTRDTFLVTVLPLPTLTLDLGPDIVLCQDSTITFHAGTGFKSYLWQDGSTDSTFTTSLYGVYSVEVTDACGQVQHDTVLLTVSLLGDTPFPDSTICVGESLTVSMPGFDTYLWAPANALNCDTCATIVLQPVVTTQYTLLASTQAGCVTRDTFLVTVLPLPVRTEVIEFFPGDTVLLGGIVYNQPDTVMLILPASVGCDTVITYILRFRTMVSIACPGNLTVSVPAGNPGTVIDYNLPTATTTCPDTTLTYTLLSGLPVGGLFPVGLTQVCYLIADACGNADTCCFQLTVEEQAPPCDVKTIGCLRYELLGIKLDALNNRRYSIRVTNTCADALVYTAFELPSGINGVAPADGSVFTTANGRKYEVRNPNASPFHSIRFKAQAGTVLNLGASDVFEYRLPPQTAPDYIHVTAKLESGQTYSALLNTFYCPVQPYTNFGPGSGAERTARTLMVFPNPTDGRLFADCSDWAGQTLQMRIINTQGQSVQVLSLTADYTPLALDLPDSLPNGLYFIQLLSAEGQRTIQRFVVQR